MNILFYYIIITVTIVKIMTVIHENNYAVWLLRKLEKVYHVYTRLCHIASMPHYRENPTSKDGNIMIGQRVMNS